MAAKAMHRCCRLLRVSSSCVRAAVPSAGGTVVISRVSSQSPLPSLTSSFSRRSETLPAKEHAQRTQPERSELDGLIDSASTAEDLFYIGEHYPVNGNHTATIIVRLSRMVGEKKVELCGVLEDPRFQQLLQTTHSQVWNTVLVNLLKSLYLLGLDGQELRSVEQEVRWRLRRLTFKHVASLAEHMAVGVPKGGQKELLSELVKQLELRWTEIDNSRTVGVLMMKVGGLSPTLMDRLEDKGLELAEEFTPEDTRKVAMGLAVQNRRSIPLLRALSYHLVQKHFALSTNVLLDLAFAYGKLNFHQTQVFQKIALELQPRVPEMSPGDVVRCVKSFAYLKWLNLPLFEAFAQSVLDRVGRFSPLQLSNIILAFARLNFRPANAESFYGAVLTRLEDQMDTFDPHVLLDLVWSLCVLQQAKAVHLRQVLVPEFHTQFLGIESQKGQNYRLKLIHVNATAQLECADYNGPFLPQEALCVEQLPGERKATPLQRNLRGVLEGLVGEEGKVRFNVDTIYGWQFDAEMILDSDNQPLPIADFEAPHLVHSAGSQTLPSGARRVAFLRWEFPNFSNRSKDLLGRFVLARRHLREAGFLIADVPYYEWMDLKSEWQKTAYLRDKMSKAVAEEMAK